jgi:hypothetical protein
MVKIPLCCCAARISPCTRPSATNPACAFSFASTNLWRGALSPNRALGPLVRRLLDHGHDTGHMLEDGLRTVFRAFRDGLSCSELSVTPLGGALFGAEATPLLERLAWGERAVALLQLDDHRGELAPRLRQRLNAIVERQHAIAAVPLGCIHRDVAGLEQIVDAVAVERGQSARHREWRHVVRSRV